MNIENNNESKKKSTWDLILKVYLETPNNQNQPEITKYKPFIISTF